MRKLIAQICEALPVNFPCSKFAFSPSLSVSPSVPLILTLSRSLCLTFSLFCNEGHQPSRDPVPQEESKRPPPPPSVCFFITYYLCLTDLLQTNGCHMEKERQRGREEGKEEKLSAVSSYFMIL